VTLPGVRHPLPMLVLTVFTVLAWRSLSRWRRTEAEPASLDDEIAASAERWDARHGPPDGVADASDDEPWRASLPPSSGWRDSADDEEPMDFR
jgi:hypothetical protein